MKLPDLTDPLAWEKISSEQLKHHIFNDHLCSHFVMKQYGVPRFDIELANYRNFNLQEVADNTSTVIKVNSSRLEIPTYNKHSWGHLIAQSLAYMEHLDLAKVDWKTLHTYIPHTKNLELRIDESTTPDVAFMPTNIYETSGFDQFSRKNIGI